MKKKRIKFSEGGDIPDIPREPLRDSSGRRVRSGMDTFTKRFAYNRSIDTPDEDDGDVVMSGSTEMRQGRQFPKMFDAYEEYVKSPAYKEDRELGKRMRAERDAAEEERKKPTEVKPVREPDLPKQLKTEDTDESDRRREEIGKLPQKTRGKPKSTNASEAPGSTDVERPYGAFRGNRSDTETDANKRSRGAFRGIRNDSAKDAENKKRGAFRGTRSDSASEMNKRGAFRGTRSDMSQDYFAKGGKVGSASKRADGIAQRGKTRGMMR